MKKLKVKKGSTCMACLACVGACSEAFYKVFDPDKACLQIVEKKAVRPIACPQCGKCAEACPEGAITQNPKGVYMINKKKCTGCGACAKACPFGLIGDLLDAPDRHNRQIVVKCINRRFSFYFNERAFFDRIL